MKSKSNLSLYSLNYFEACNEFAVPIFASLRLQATQFFSKKYRSGGELLATLCPIFPAHNLNLRLPAPETNALSLDYLAGVFKATIIITMLDRKMLN